MTATDDMVERLTSPYNKNVNSNNWKLLKLAGDEADGIKVTISDIQNAHFINTAAGASLEKIGSLLQTPRETGESDSKYRARLKTMWQKYIGSATIQDIKTNIATILNVAESRINLTEDFSTAYAHFKVQVYAADLTAGGITAPELKDFIGAIKSAGVSTEILQDGTFEARGAADPNDSTKGYNDIANTNPGGGTYAGVL